MVPLLSYTENISTLAGMSIKENHITLYIYLCT